MAAVRAGSNPAHSIEIWQEGSGIAEDPYLINTTDQNQIFFLKFLQYKDFPAYVFMKAGKA
jgi:hypothetical protein